MSGKLLYYKGYTGDINYSQEDDCYYGVVKDITGLVSYEGSTWENLEKDTLFWNVPYPISTTV